MYKLSYWQPRAQSPQGERIHIERHGQVCSQCPVSHSSPAELRIVWRTVGNSEEKKRSLENVATDSEDE
jgi:hypothetical protein